MMPAPWGEFSIIYTYTFKLEYTWAMENLVVQQMTCTRLPTEAGVFTLCLYHNNRDDKEHLVLVMGDVMGEENVLVRVHSECFTGDVLGSLRCDCGPQLNRAMDLIAESGVGVIVYLRQEGRGIGLLDKLRAYNLQDQGYDTVDANLMLGHQADARDYSIAADILQDLGVMSVRLLTNNPDKIESLQKLGVRVTERVPLHTRVTAENAAYLATKVSRMRHLLNSDLFPLNLRHAEGTLPLNGQRTRPFVTLSYAQSLDGSLTDQRGRPLPISGAEAHHLTHKLRANHEAILVGIGTVLSDDPQLTVRLVEGANPQPVIVDSQLRFPLTSRLLRHPQHQPWIVTTDTAVSPQQFALEKAGARIVRLPADTHGQVNLPALLDWLYAAGISSLMVEGGARVISNFLSQQLVDRVVLTIAPMFVGGLNALDGQKRPFPSPHLPRLNNLRYQRLGDDMIVYGDVAWPENDPLDA